MVDEGSAPVPPAAPITMLPYTQIQIAYACSTSSAGFMLWSAARRIDYLAAHPRWRTLAVGAILAILAAACGFCFESLFASVAVLFYTGALTLPAVVFWQQRGARAKDWPSIGLAVFAPLVASYAAFVAPNDLRVVERTLAFQAWPTSAAPFTLVQISDLQTVGPCARQDEAVALVNAQDPDLIAVCGDYIAGPFFDAQPAIDAARAFFGALHAKYGIVCVKGHSETRALRERVFAGLRVRCLDDEEFTLELSPGQRLRVIGLGYDEPKFAPRRENGTLTLVVSHVPDQSNSLIGRDVDLHLAGHTHGGQIAIPGYGALITLSSLPHEFARGLFGFGDHWLSVTPGIGMEGYHAPRVRLFCPPEIDVLRLEGGGKPFEWTAPPLTSRARAGTR